MQQSSTAKWVLILCLAIPQRGLIDAQPFPDILLNQYPVGSMLQLVPLGEIAQRMLVRAFQVVSVREVELTKAACRHRGRIQEFLLKKQRTRRCNPGAVSGKPVPPCRLLGLRIHSITCAVRIIALSLQRKTTLPGWSSRAPVPEPGRPPAAYSWTLLLNVMKVAVIGATGLVGTRMLEVLSQRNFPAREVLVAASAATRPYPAP